VDEDRVRAIESHEPVRDRVWQRAVVDADERDRERPQFALRSDLGVGGELGETALAEQARRHVGELAIGAPGTKDHTSVAKSREERVPGDAGRVAMRDR
jgi:hypothetical protein